MLGATLTAAACVAQLAAPLVDGRAVERGYRPLALKPYALVQTTNRPAGGRSNHKPLCDHGPWCRSPAPSHLI